MKIPMTTALFSLVLLFAGANYAKAGTYIEQKVTSSERGMNLNVRAWADGDNGKVEFAKSDSDMMPKGSYLLTNDGGKTAFLVNPSKKSYSPWDIGAIFAALGQFMEESQGMVDIEFKNPVAEDLGSEQGEDLLGMSTTKNSWRTAYALEMKVVFMTQKRNVETTTNAWVTDEVDLDALQSLWFSVNPPRTGNKDFDFILTQGLDQVDGMPLKIVQQTRMSKKKRGGNKSKMTMEVTELRDESIGPEVFTMPEDYDMVPLFDFGQQDTGESQEENPMDDLGGLFEEQN